MKSIDFILTGFSGQGILFITKIISMIPMFKDYEVILSEIHGIGKKGEPVTSHIRIGDPNFSIIRKKTVDFILSLEENEAIKNIGYLKSGGEIYTNISDSFMPNYDLKQYCYENNILCNTIKASKIVKKLLSPNCLNLAVLGYFFSFKHFFCCKEDVRSTIIRFTPHRVKKMNLMIFDFCSQSVPINYY